MLRSRYSHQSPSISSASSTQRSAASARKSPVPPGYEYLGRLVTRERPVVQKSKSAQHKPSYSQIKRHQQYILQAQDRAEYEDATQSSDGDDIDDVDGLSKPVGIIRINDQHLREIYRLPTPPPKVKRVYHRLRSPETKVIERVFVRRPPPQIIENIIEVPQQKVRIVNREKFLGKAKPITRSKLVHLRDDEREDENEEEEEQQPPPPQIAAQQPADPVILAAQQAAQAPSQPQAYQQQQTFQQPQVVCNASGQCYIPQQTQQQPTQTTTYTHVPHQPQMPPTTTTTTTTAMVYPPQPNMRTVGYVQSSIPPHVMFNSQQPLQMPSPQTPQPTPYTFVPQQTTGQQMMMTPGATYKYVPQTSTPSMPAFRHAHF